MNSFSFLRYITYALIIIGALNWGLVGLFGVDLVAVLLGEMTMPARLVYDLVGFAAIINLVVELTVCKCSTKCTI